MSTETQPEPEELHALVRAARQRLEALSRAGLKRLRLPEGVAPIRLPQPVAEVADPAPVSAAPVARPTARPPVAPAAPTRPATASSLFGEAGFSGPVLGVGERVAQLNALQEEVSRCTRCPVLVDYRTQTVFGTGSPTARLMFVGEGPGADEDREGIPFVGRAGALLTDMITKGMGLTREEVYIANVVKSRPPENRTPLPDEVKNCLPFLERQIEIIRPEFLCLLGKTAASALLETALPIGKLRGRWHRYKGIPAVVTWHPAYLLRQPTAKKDTWEDLQLLMNAMGLKIPGRKKQSEPE